MTRPQRLWARELRRLAWAAAFVLCSTQAAAELHLHDADLPDGCCAACTLAHADLVDTTIDDRVPEPARIRGMAAPRAGVPAVARPFEAERSRAPPLHF